MTTSLCTHPCSVLSEPCVLYSDKGQQLPICESADILFSITKRMMGSLVPFLATISLVRVAFVKHALKRLVWLFYLCSV